MRRYTRVNGLARPWSPTSPMSSSRTLENCPLLLLIKTGNISDKFIINLYKSTAGYNPLTKHANFTVSVPHVSFHITYYSYFAAGVLKYVFLDVVATTKQVCFIGHQPSWRHVRSTLLKLILQFLNSLRIPLESPSKIIFHQLDQKKCIFRVSPRLLSYRHIVPILNPDGYEYTHTCDRMWRKNKAKHGGVCVGVDLNRNFR